MIIANIIGYTAVALCFVAYLMKSRKGILIIRAVMEALWVIHFFLIGAYTGCITNAICGVREVVYTSKKLVNSKYHFLIPIFFGILCTICTALTWGGYISLLPLIATYIDIIGLFQKNAIVIRIISVPSMSLWIVYSYMTNSIPGIIANVLALISIGIVFVYKFVEYKRMKIKK